MYMAPYRYSSQISQIVCQCAAARLPIKSSDMWVWARHNIMRHGNSKHLTAFILITFVLLILIMNLRLHESHEGYSGYIEKLKVKTQRIETVDLQKVIRSEESNIFFIETNNDIVALHPRLLCAFESAAMHNPRMKVQI